MKKKCWSKIRIPRRRWKQFTKRDLKMMCGCVDLIHIPLNRILLWSVCQHDNKHSVCLRHSTFFTNIRAGSEKSSVPHIVLWVLSFVSQIQGGHSLGVLENKVLRLLLGPKMEGVTEIEEDYITRSFMICMLVVKYYSGDRIKKKWMGRGHVINMWDTRDAYRILFGRPECERLLGKTRRRRNNDIKMVLKGMGWWGMDWVVLDQDKDRRRAFVNAAMNPRVPQIAGSFVTGLGPVSFSRSTLF